MAITIDNTFVKTFESTVRHLAQQGESKLRGLVVERSGPTAEHSFKRIGKQRMQPKTGRRANTPENDTIWSNRVVNATTYDVGDTVEKEDMVKTLISPTAEITRAFAMAAKRQFDEIIIDAATANALDEAGNINTFPAAQIVGDGTSEISFKMVTEVNRRFLENDIDPEVPKIAVIGPKQAEKLMHDPKATSSDFVNAKQLVNGGYVRNWMGCHWIVSNLLNSTDPGTLDCLFFTRSALGMLVLEDVSTEIAKDPSKSFMWRVYARLTAGAVRVEDEHIFALRVKDTTTIV